MQRVASLKRTSEDQHIQQTESMERIETTLEAIRTRYFAPRDSRSASAQPVPVSMHDLTLLEGQFKSLSLTSILAQQQAIITSLSFDTRLMRYESIPEAHEKTFSWVYRKDMKYQVHQGKMVEWLRNGFGIFWVSGKPGSGKSTFMKYVCNNRQTPEALATWAKPQKVVIASHYFWIAGTDMQKSQLGLLQELLLGILCQQPELIQHVCPTRCENGQSVATLRRKAWNIKELREALSLLATLRPSDPKLDVKFCLFIDGLDEYDGDHLDLCGDLLALTKSGKIKICASSRPRNIFKDTLGSDSSKTIFMQHLTRNDIQTFRLEDHPRWAHLSGQPESGTALIDEIIEKSCGVFLWVHIVTKLLRQGLNNDDSYSDLTRRTDSFPSDLGDFFKHILDGVDPFYHAQMAGALQIAVEGPGPLSYLMYTFLEQEYDDENYAQAMQIRNSLMHEEELKGLHDKVVRRLEGHCRGLLEVGDIYVTFLHRTVSDFLKSPKMAEYLAEKSGPNFNASLALIRGTLASVKATSSTMIKRMGGRHGVGKGSGEVIAHFTRAVSYASKLDRDCPEKAHKFHPLLDLLEQTVCTLNANSTLFPGPRETSDNAARQFFRSQIIKYLVEGYLTRKLKDEIDYLDDFDQSPLAILTHPGVHARIYKTPQYQSSAGHRMLNLLLEYEEDPNGSYCDAGRNTATFEWTPWTTFLYHVSNLERIDYGYMPRFNASWFLSFLEHGANRNALVYRSITNLRPEFSTAWVDFTLLIFKMKSQWAANEAYLEVLDSFLSQEIDINILVAHPCGSGDKQKFHEVFFSHLAIMAEDKPARLSTNDVPSESRTRGVSGLRNSYLLREVILRILKLGHGHDWPMDDIWSLLGKTFGGRQQSLMKNRLANALNKGRMDSQETGPKKKRKHEDETESVSDRAIDGMKG